MIDINRNNYEEYFLDFMEGNLSPFMKNQLMSFLDQNPDLKAELELFDEEPVLIENHAFENKSSLKKESILSGLTENNFDELCIAQIENDLSEQETILFDQSISQDVQKQQDFGLYQLTKLKPDNSIVFKYKKSLKKNTNGLIWQKNYTAISIAASIVILIALYLFIPKESQDAIETHFSEIVKTETEKPVNTIKETQRTQSSKEEKNIIQVAEKQKELELNKATEDNKEVIEVKIEGTQSEREYYQIAQLEPREINYHFIQKKDVGIIDVQLNEYILQKEQTNYLSLKSYLASRVNKRVTDKKDKEKLEFFDIAQAGVDGINRLTGGKMTLERIYDKNGNATKTEFNSRLIAFSAPVKKD